MVAGDSKLLAEIVNVVVCPSSKVCLAMLTWASLSSSLGGTTIVVCREEALGWPGPDRVVRRSVCSRVDAGWSLSLTVTITVVEVILEFSCDCAGVNVKASVSSELSAIVTGLSGACSAVIISAAESPSFSTKLRGGTGLG